MFVTFFTEKNIINIKNYNIKYKECNKKTNKLIADNKLKPIKRIVKIRMLSLKQKTDKQLVTWAEERN